jgi:hypothetical protein
MKGEVFMTKEQRINATWTPFWQTSETRLSYRSCLGHYTSCFIYGAVVPKSVKQPGEVFENRVLRRI